MTISCLIAAGRLRHCRTIALLDAPRGWRGRVFLTARPGCRRLLHRADLDLARRVVRIADRPASLTAREVEMVETITERESHVWTIGTLTLIALAILWAMRTVL